MQDTIVYSSSTEDTLKGDTYLLIILNWICLKFETYS